MIRTFRRDGLASWFIWSFPFHRCNPRPANLNKTVPDLINPPLFFLVRKASSTKRMNRIFHRYLPRHGFAHHTGIIVWTTQMRYRAQGSLHISAPNMHGECACRHSTIMPLCPILGQGVWRVQNHDDSQIYYPDIGAGPARNLRNMFWLASRIWNNRFIAAMSMSSCVGCIGSGGWPSASY